MCAQGQLVSLNLNFSNDSTLEELLSLNQKYVSESLIFVTVRETNTCCDKLKLLSVLQYSDVPKYLHISLNNFQSRVCRYLCSATVTSVTSLTVILHNNTTT